MAEDADVDGDGARAEEDRAGSDGSDGDVTVSAARGCHALKGSIGGDVIFLGAVRNVLMC